MVREALRQRFLAALRQSGGSAGNTRLCGELGWQDDTYWAVHAALIEEGVVEAGRGRGGSVSLVNGERHPAAQVRPVQAQRHDVAPAPRKAENGGRGFEQTFRNIDDVLWKEAGCTTELNYTEQTSWMLFLKYLDDLEQERALRAELEGKRHERIIEPAYRWSAWAAPRTADGAFDHDKALTGPDLIDFVNGRLFPYLRGFRTRAAGPNTIEYKIGEIFSEIGNKFRSGYSLRDALELVDALRFRSQAERHELSALYEDKTAANTTRRAR
jgi:type I restriction enzyme M protein